MVTDESDSSTVAKALATIEEAAARLRWGNGTRSQGVLLDPAPLQFPRFERYEVAEMASRLRIRSSARKFQEWPLARTHLTTLLGSLSAGAGRRAPSPGGLRGFEYFVVAQRVEGFVPGTLLHPILSAGCVELLWEVDTRRFLLEAETWACDAQLLVVLALDYLPYVAKYGPRGVRLADIEAGARLMALEDDLWTACGVRGCWIGGFDDDACSWELGISGLAEGMSPVCAIAMGYAVPQLASEQSELVPAHEFGLVPLSASQFAGLDVKQFERRPTKRMRVDTRSLFIGSESELRTAPISRVALGEVPFRRGYLPRLHRVGTNSYLVVDGHHRVAMHRTIGHRTLSALVSE